MQLKYNAYLNPIISLVLGKDTETGARHTKKSLENYVAFGLYNIYLQNKTKNETVKEGGFSLENYAHSCQTNLPEKMATGLRSLDNFLQGVCSFKTFLYALRVRSPLKLKRLKDYKTLVKSCS